MPGGFSATLRRSSLSKEVLFTGLFGLGLLLVVLGIFLHRSFYLFILLAGAAGFGLIYHMAQVYRLPAAPGWNTWRTNASFMVSAFLLGNAAMIPLLAYESNITGIRIPAMQWTVIGFSVLALLLGQLLLSPKQAAPAPTQGTRIGVILIGRGTGCNCLVPLWR